MEKSTGVNVKWSIKKKVHLRNNIIICIMNMQCWTYSYVFHSTFLFYVFHKIWLYPTCTLFSIHPTQIYIHTKHMYILNVTIDLCTAFLSKDTWNNDYFLDCLYFPPLTFWNFPPFTSVFFLYTSQVINLSSPLSFMSTFLHALSTSRTCVTAKRIWELSSSASHHPGELSHIFKSLQRGQGSSKESSIA